MRTNNFYVSTNLALGSIASSASSFVAGPVPSSVTGPAPGSVNNSAPSSLTIPTPVAIASRVDHMVIDLETTFFYSK